MHLYCHTLSLARGLAVVSRAITGRPSPFPGFVQLTAQRDGQVQLYATNTEVFITCLVEADVRQEGTIILSAKLFLDLIHSLPDEILELRTADEDNDSVAIAGRMPLLTCISSYGRIQVRGGDMRNLLAFPAFLSTDETIMAEMDATQLKAVMKQVVGVASSDPGRPVLSAILVRIDAAHGRFTFVATDSFRLAVRPSSFSSEGLLPHDYDVLIPAHALSDLMHILSDDEVVHWQVDLTHQLVLFQTSRIQLASVLVTGTFPDFTRIIPTAYTTRAVIGARSLSSALHQMMPFVQAHQTPSISLRLNKEQEQHAAGTLIVNVTSEEFGAMTCSLAATVTGPTQHLMVNPKLLTSLLAVLPTDEVALDVQTPQTPLVLRPVHAAEEEESCTYIVMPVVAVGNRTEVPARSA